MPTVPERGELSEWPVPILIAYLAGDPDSSTLIVDDTHQFVLRQGDLVAAWTEGVEQQGSAEDRIVRAVEAEGEFVVHRGQDLLLGRDEADVELPGLRAILVAARAWNDPERMDAEIDAIVGDASLCLEDGVVLDDFGFDDEERAVVDQLVDPGVRDYAHLVERVDPDVARRVVWSLAVTEHLSSVPSMMLLAAEDHQSAQDALAEGDLETAVSRAARAVACDARPQYRAFHAYLHGLQGQKAELPIAIALLDKAIADEPDRARSYCYRAKLRERAGQTQLAHQDWARARELDPDDPMVARSSPTLPPAPPITGEVPKRGFLAALGALVGRKDKG